MRRFAFEPIYDAPMRCTTTRLKPSLACFLLAPIACSSDATQLSWTIALEDPVRVGDEDDVVAWIARGGCNSQDQILEVELLADAGTSGITTLPPGTYGFAAELRDQTCRPVAFGCVERHLPSASSAPLEIVLRAQDAAAPRCTPDRCQAGHCLEQVPGAGDLDASLQRDGAMSDAQVHAGAPPPSDAASASDGALSSAMADGSAHAATDARTLDATQLDCPDGVRRSGGSCYRFLSDPADYFTAREQCALWGGAHATIIGDATEDAWVNATFGSDNDFWLGITDSSFEGVWMTDQYPPIPLTYTHWDETYPNVGYQADCAYYESARAKWRAGSCYGEHGVLCEQSAW